MSEQARNEAGNEGRSVTGVLPDFEGRFKLLIEEGYRRFPDVTEPSEHPLGKIVVDRGSLRFAFLEGALHALHSVKVRP